MKFDNFNAVDNGFANLTGGSGSPNSLGVLPLQPLPNFTDLFAFETTPPSNIGLPTTAMMIGSQLQSVSNLKLVICMEYAGVQGSNPASDSQYATAKQQWFDRIRPVTIAFMRNAKTVTSVNYLINQFGIANSMISINPLGSYKPFRFRYFLAYLNI